MLWTVIVIVLIVWLLGWQVYPLGGGLIHLLLVVVLVILVYQLVTGRRV